MTIDRLAIAQQGIALANFTGARFNRISGIAASKKRTIYSRSRAASARAAGSLWGPFLSPGLLSQAERLEIIDGIERVLEGVYTHLPLKRARYGFDPVQRLRILRSQVSELTDDVFHIELASVLTRLRDAHTRYIGPMVLANKVAVLPFMVEMIGKSDAPTYVVTKVGAGLDPAFQPGVVLEYWNAVPIDRAVQRYSDQEVGGRPDSQRAWAVQSLTLRALQFSPPPDEHWVVVGYRTVSPRGEAGQAKEIKIPWQIVDPSQIASVVSSGATGRQAKTLRRTRAIDPAAEAIRRAKMLLFAPHVLTGEKDSSPSLRRRGSRRRGPTMSLIATTLPGTIKTMSIDAPGGPFGYLRIYGFNTDPQPFIDELLRLIPFLPDRGLIIDVRSNPGGYIWAAEIALQLFTPKEIKPTRFSALATSFTRQMSSIGDVADDLKPWKASLEAAVRNGELYAQTIPITDPADCNAIGQQYGGPVVLIGDSTTYSAGDLFCAGFVDNSIGPFICVGSATGAGGANVWQYNELCQALAGSSISLPTMPDGIDLSFSFRRATRSGSNEGLPIEDVGVEGTTYAMTRDDLLNGNRDLIAYCVTVLKKLPFSRLSTVLDRTNRSIKITTTGLDRLDTLVDGHPGSSQLMTQDATVTVSYPAGTKTVEFVGFAGKDILQRRRFSVRP